LKRFITPILAVAVLLLAGLSGAMPAYADAADQPCGTSSTPPATFQHVVVIVMENRSLSQIKGSPNAPYLNNLINKCGIAGNYHHIGNGNADKILMTSGGQWGYSVWKGPSARVKAPNIFSQTKGSWRLLAENMPKPCDRQDGNGYVYRHNPALAYTNIKQQCLSKNVRLGSDPNISARYTMILPAMGDSMHAYRGSAGTAGLTESGDRWLSNIVPKIVNSSEYQSGNTALFIVWDEGGSLLPCIVVSPYTQPGTVSMVNANHKVLFRTTEDLLGLPPTAAVKSTPSMAASFGLK
jgi:hypothetical protein